MLEEALVIERETNTQTAQVNINKMGETLKELLNETQETMAVGFTKQIDQQARDLESYKKSTNEYIDEVNEMVKQHEQNFLEEEKEPEELSPEEMEERGITVRYGMMFDRNGNMVKLTKK